MTRTITRHRPPGLAWLAAGTALAATAALTALAPAAAASPAAVVDGAATYQRIDGFGASEAFGEAASVQAAPAAAQRQIFRLLYGRSRGAGMTILRNLIPSDAAHTIEPAAPASPASPPAYRPLNGDWGQVWFTRHALRAGVRTVYADAWSAPGFMKTNGSESGGGTLCGVAGASCASGDWRQAFARYLVRYLRDYRAAGVRIGYVGFENEPNLTTSYSSMVMSPAQSADFAGVLGPVLARSGLGTRLACCDAEGWNYAPSYTAAVTTGPAGRYVSLITSHGYTAPPGSPLPARGRPVWQTEWSTFQKWDPAWDDGTTASGFTWAQNIYRGLTAADLNGFLYWWGTSTPAMNGDNESLIQLSGSSVIPSGRLWAFTAFSRFIRPGAVRLGATSPAAGLELTAFRDPGGSLAVVAINTTASTITLPVALRRTGPLAGALAAPYLTDASHDTAAQPPVPVRGGAFTATVPPRAVVTYLIRPGARR